MSLETDIIEILTNLANHNLMITRKMLREYLNNLCHHTISDRKLRIIVKHMIEQDGQPIGTTCHGGYYWITSPEEWEANYQELMHRIRSLGKRAIVYRRNMLRARMEGQRPLNGGMG